MKKLIVISLIACVSFFVHADPPPYVLPSLTTYYMAGLLYNGTNAQSARDYIGALSSADISNVQTNGGTNYTEVEPMFMPNTAAIRSQVFDFGIYNPFFGNTSYPESQFLGGGVAGSIKHTVQGEIYYGATNTMGLTPKFTELSFIGLNGQSIFKIAYDLTTNGNDRISAPNDLEVLRNLFVSGFQIFTNKFTTTVVPTVVQSDLSGQIKVYGSTNATTATNLAATSASVTAVGLTGSASLTTAGALTISFTNSFTNVPTFTGGGTWSQVTNGNVVTWTYIPASQTNGFGTVISHNYSEFDLIGASVATTNRLFVTPFQFSGVGNGTSDDSIAVNACIDYINTNTINIKEINFAGGSWLVSTTHDILCYAPELHGGDCVFQTTNLDALFKFPLNTSYGTLGGSSVQKPWLHDMTLGFRGTPVDTNFGIWLGSKPGASYRDAAKIERVAFTNFFRSIAIYGWGNVDIDTCQPFNCESNAVYLNTYSGNPDIVHIHNCNINEYDSPNPQSLARSQNVIAIQSDSGNYGIYLSDNNAGAVKQIFKGKNSNLYIENDVWEQFHTVNTNICLIEMNGGRLRVNGLNASFAGQAFGSSNYTAMFGLYACDTVNSLIEGVVAPTFDTLAGNQIDRPPSVVGYNMIQRHHTTLGDNPRIDSYPQGTVPNVGDVNTFTRQQIFQGQGTIFNYAQTYFGSDDSGTTLTANNGHQWAAIVPGYGSTSYNLFLMKFAAASANNNIVYWGGDYGQIGVTQHRFFTSADGSTVATEKWRIDSSGNFLPQVDANICSASGYGDSIYFTNFFGGGANLTALNATQLTSGTVPFARLPTFTGDGTNSSAGVFSLATSGASAGTYRSVTVTAKGIVTAGSNPTTYAGYGLSDTSANFFATITDESGSGAVIGGTKPTISNPTFSGETNTDATASQYATFDANKAMASTVNGNSWTNLNGSNIASGTVADARLSANIPLLNANNTFNGNNVFTNTSTNALTILMPLGAGALKLAYGSGSDTTYVGQDVNGGQTYITCNNNPASSKLDKATQPAWAIEMGYLDDSLRIFRAGANGANSNCNYSQVFRISSGGSITAGTIPAASISSGTLAANVSASSLVNSNFTGCAGQTNIFVYTVPSSVTNTYQVGGYINVTAVTLDVVQAKVLFTDETGTSQTVALMSSGVGAIQFSTMVTSQIRAKGGTTITLQATLTTGTGSIAFDCGGNLDLKQ